MRASLVLVVATQILLVANVAAQAGAQALPRNPFVRNFRAIEKIEKKMEREEKKSKSDLKAINAMMKDIEKEQEKIQDIKLKVWGDIDKKLEKLGEQMVELDGRGQPINKLLQEEEKLRREKAVIEAMAEGNLDEFLEKEKQDAADAADRAAKEADAPAPEEVDKDTVRKLFE